MLTRSADLSKYAPKPLIGRQRHLPLCAAKLNKASSFMWPQVGRLAVQQAKQLNASPSIDKPKQKSDRL